MFGRKQLRDTKGKVTTKLNVSPGSSTVGWTTAKSTGYVCLAVVINPAASSVIGLATQILLFENPTIL